jgi:quinol monooxygenase YgiN
MPYLLVRHKVEEYAKWKTLFDEQAPTRQQGGSRGGQLFRNVNDPNELVILFAWDDVGHASQFIESEELREMMQQAGVADSPDLYFLEAVEHVPA